MTAKMENLLASPLDKAINYFKENDLTYSLLEIKPPSAKKIAGRKNKNEIKRVLKIKKEKDSFKIYWSFQYNK